MVQRTLFIIKPDAIRKGLSSKIMKEVRDSGLNILTHKKITPSKEILEKLYAEHKGKPFYEKLVGYISSGPAICAVVEGVNAVTKLRDLMGDTCPSKASNDSIRGKYRGESDIGPSGAIENLVHGSDSPERAKKEIAIFFGDKWAV